MICEKCKNPGVFVQLTQCEFYYCRTCKDEIKLVPKKDDFDFNSDLIEEFERMIELGYGDLL